MSEDLPKFWFIYGIRSGDNPYRYVGYTTRRNPQQRLDQHLLDAPRYDWPVYRWIMNQEADTLCIDIIEECPHGDKDFLYERERFWIEYYRNAQGSLTDQKTDSYLLNILNGGGGRIGVKHSQATKDKMSSTRRSLPPSGHKHSDDARRRIGEAHKGKTVTAETREKLSRAKLGNPQAHYALHVRHHVKTGKVKDTCSYCAT